MDKAGLLTPEDFLKDQVCGRSIVDRDGMRAMLNDRVELSLQIWLGNNYMCRKAEKFGCEGQSLAMIAG